MNIALPLLLLILGGLTLWLLTESQLKWYFKAACISTFCIFTIIFWSSIHSYLGWPANESDMPEKVLIHWVIIKEPNKFKESDGAIYIIAESTEKETSSIRKLFGYNKDMIEPRLYKLEYNRQLHEHLQQSIIPKLKSGQPVYGKLTKKKDPPPGLSMQPGKSRLTNGDGSESQEQKWHFHELLPSEIHEKPQN
tara:strand:+ start:143 stop:724 length:582 start_codon:yes stop_codon:yes gene_type:complete